MLNRRLMLLQAATASNNILWERHNFSGRAETGIHLKDYNQWAVFIDVTVNSKTDSDTIFHYMHENNPYPGIVADLMYNNIRFVSVNGAPKQAYSSNVIGMRIKLVIYCDGLNIGVKTDSAVSFIANEVSLTKLQSVPFPACFGGYTDTSGNPGRILDGVFHTAIIKNSADMADIDSFLGGE